jgi:hypothetical protein
MSAESEPSAEAAPLCCARCAVALQPGRGNFFRVTIEAVADPTTPSFSAEDLAADVRQQIERLLATAGPVRAGSAGAGLSAPHLPPLHPCYRTWIDNPTG